MKINPQWSEMERLEQLELMGWKMVHNCAEKAAQITAPSMAGLAEARKKDEEMRNEAFEIQEKCGEIGSNIQAYYGPGNEQDIHSQLTLMNLALDALRKSEMFLADIMNTKGIMMQSQEMRRQKSGIAIPAR